MNGLSLKGFIIYLCGNADALLKVLLCRVLYKISVPKLHRPYLNTLFMMSVQNSGFGTAGIFLSGNPQRFCAVLYASPFGYC